MNFVNFVVYFNKNTMNKSCFALFISLVLLIQSCDNEVDIIAEYKDIPVVYGLINQRDSIHFIKINKAFLGEEDAYSMAMNPDSSSYNGLISGYITEFYNGDSLRTFPLDTTYVYDKEEGVFYAPRQLMYYTTGDLCPQWSSFPFDGNYVYKLTLINEKTGKVITSQTNMIKPFEVKVPAYVVIPGSLPRIRFNGDFTARAKWTSAENGKLYQLTFRFYFIEKNIITGDTTERHVDWNIGQVKSYSSNGSQEMTLSYHVGYFYYNLKDNLEIDPNIIRRAGKLENEKAQVDLFFSVASQDFFDYRELNTNTNSILQEPPQYTNIENGIGLFTSRYNQRRGPYELDADSEYELIYGEFTKDLNFVYEFE